jgi:2-(1,2-epoxy-1,2-dihydrophenyl)acetyl-CoA isomerase
VQHDGSVVWIVLNRPDALNAFNDAMGEAFLAALDQADEDSVRCVVITGEGRAFCSGEDLRALAGGYAEGRPPDLSEILRRRYNPAIARIQALRKPVVAAVNGVAAGAGVSIALACDYRLMAEDASLVLAFPKVGLIPDSGASWLLPRYLGVGRTLELSFSGEPILAARAFALGLVNRLAPAAEIRQVTREVAAQLADGPTFAYGLAKELVWKASAAELKEQLDAEAEAQAAAGRSADHLEGMNAFLGKRSARFEGR